MTDVPRSLTSLIQGSALAAERRRHRLLIAHVRNLARIGQRSPKAARDACGHILKATGDDPPLTLHTAVDLALRDPPVPPEVTLAHLKELAGEVVVALVAAGRSETEAGADVATAVVAVLKARGLWHSDSHTEPANDDQPTRYVAPDAAERLTDETQSPANPAAGDVAEKEPTE